jgi:hypothetical protein
MLTSVEGRKRRSTNPTVSEELEGEYIIGVYQNGWQGIADGRREGD